MLRSRLLLLMFSGLLLVAGIHALWLSVKRAPTYVEAVASNPTRGDLWLALAADDGNFSVQARSAFFEMAYLMAGENKDVIPERLSVAAVSLDLQNATVRKYFKLDLESIVGVAGSKAKLTQLYAASSARNRIIIAAIIRELDPSARAAPSGPD